MLQGNEFPEAPPQKDGVLGESFISDITLRRFSFKVPPLSISSPWKKSHLNFRRARIKATAQNLCFVL